MKRVYLLWGFLLMLVLSQEAWAQSESALVLTSARGERFLAMIDGRRINPSPANHISVGRIPPGKHTLDIQVLRRGPNQIIRSRVVLEPGLETDFELVPGRRGNLILRRIGEQPIQARASSTARERAATSFPETVREPAPASTPAISSEAEPIEDGPACKDAMRETEVDKIIKQMQAVNESEQRYSIARSAVRSSGSILVDDLVRLMKEIPGDEWRLHLAKFGYLYVCDQKFFDRVYNAFEQKESAQELQKYIAAQR